jgi:TonB-dependent starch-binding outer membrane protein SusC
MYEQITRSFIECLNRLSIFFKNFGLNRLNAKRILSLMVGVFVFCFGTVFAQSIEITGTVTDAGDGSALPGVTVVIQGTTTGTVTNVDGNYSIEVESGSILNFSFIGYQTYNITIQDQEVIDVELERAVTDLDELVVVGYGTQRAATLTGSIARTSDAELVASPAISVSNSLAGLLPGVVALNRSGEPGADVATILIRGQNTTGNTSPLIVVDGIQNPSGWERINQNDIEQITVLKDASAAIYGAQAANGVILITTKRGMIGEPQINYTFNQGINQPTRTPELASSATFAEYVNQMLVQEGQNPRYTDEEIQKFRDGSDPVNYPNTDWYGEVLKSYSLQSMHNLSVRGGSESVRYSVSGSYSNQNSIFKEGMHEFNGYTLRSNLDAQVSEHIGINVDVNAGLDDRIQPGAENPWGWLMAIPMMPVFYEAGYPSAGIEQGLNPRIMTTEASGENRTQTKRFSAKLGFEAELPFVQGLGVDGYFVYTNDEIFNKNWQTPWTVYNRASDGELIPLRGGRLTAPQLRQSTTKDYSTFYNFRLVYQNQIRDHSINTFIAVEQSQGINSYYTAFRRNFVSPQLDELFAGDPASQESDGVSNERARQSLISRISYNYQEKYLIDINARYDGSHAFPSGNRFGFFPGVSIAWLLSDDLLPNMQSINELKLRASVGRIGNDSIAPYQHTAAYLLGLSSGYHFGLPTTTGLGVQPGVAPNPNITWEVATTYNLGLDGLFWDGGLGIHVDVFRQNRSNILTQRDLEVPAYTALVLPDENIGRVRNQGVELALSHSNVARASNFTYSVEGNVAFARNKVIDVSEAQDVPEYQKQEGRILGAGLYYEAIGIFRTQDEVENAPVYPGTQVGDLQYRDVTGSGFISTDDMVRINKSNIPEVTFGFNTSMRYKSVSLFANFAGQARAWQYYHQNARIAINGLDDLISNRWTPGSMDSKYPRLPTLSAIGGEPSGLQSTFWLQNAAFLRLKTLEVGYDVPSNILSRLGLSSMRVYANGHNLFTISEIKWFDPEGNAPRGSFYPQNRIFNLGVNLRL